MVAISLIRLRVKSFLRLILPCLLLIVFCTLAAWWSIRIAIADWYASAGTMQGYEHAIRIAPEDPELRAHKAMLRVENGDPAPDVEDDLRLAADMNPFNSTLLMSLGLREELRGNKASAEEYFKRSVEVDHQFKPSWTLANYYYRNDEPERTWPLIKHMLALEPLGFDPSPVFELCWNVAKEQNRTAEDILNVIPTKGERPVQYLGFLMRTNRIQAASAAFPVALAAFDKKNEAESATLIDFPEFLASRNEIDGAVRAWNSLVDTQIVHAKRLDTGKGVTISDPDFEYPLVGGAFGWRLAEIPGVFVNKLTRALRMEINGEEPTEFQLLSVVAPVLSETRYRLRWKGDGKALSVPNDPGFSFQVIQNRQSPVECQPLLTPGDAECRFMTLPDVRKVSIHLRYKRAPGTTRVSGVLNLFSVRLEPVA